MRPGGPGDGDWMPATVEARCATWHIMGKGAGRLEGGQAVGARRVGDQVVKVLLSQADWWKRPSAGRGGAMWLGNGWGMKAVSAGTWRGGGGGCYGARKVRIIAAP
jgi:hypothetical protein